MSNKSTIIRNKLFITKVLLSLAISISVGNSMNLSNNDNTFKLNNFDDISSIDNDSVNYIGY